MQRVTPDIGDALGTAEQALRDSFVPDLFQGLGEVTLGRGVTHLPVKHSGLALHDTTKTVPENWTESCVITGHPVAALRGQEELRTVGHYN